MPHREEDAVDPKSRHKGKLDTEELLRRSGMIRFISESKAVAGELLAFLLLPVAGCNISNHLINKAWACHQPVTPTVSSSLFVTSPHMD